MKTLIAFLILLVITAVFISFRKKNHDTNQARQSEKGFYDFSAIDMQGNEVKMSDYRGKIVLVVNTASKCGFTPQFEGLEALYEAYKNEGLVILGFPCNQFKNQDPGDNATILDFCTKNYGVSFPMFAKVEVNGDNAHPLFKFLKNALPGTPGNDVKWNFTKFLIKTDGTPYKRYGSIVKPKDIEDDVKRLLEQK